MFVDKEINCLVFELTDVTRFLIRCLQLIKGSAKNIKTMVHFILCVFV